MIDLIWIERLGAVIAASAPALLLLGLLHHRAGLRHLREPMWVAFGFGFCLFAPVIVVEIMVGVAESRIFDPRAYGLVDAFFGAALPEELAKGLVLLFILMRHEDLGRPIDAVVPALGIALGFATIENIIMVIDEPGWVLTAASRAVVAVPGHAFYGLLMGFYATKFLADRRRRHLVAMFMVPTALHTLYDVPLLTIDRASAIGLPLEFLPMWPYVGLFLATLTCFVALAFAVVRVLRRTPAFRAPRPLGSGARLATVFD